MRHEDAELRPSRDTLVRLGCAQTCAGSVPVKQLLPTTSVCSAGRRKISSGSDPVSWLLFSLNRFSAR
jgi:hypothetical protein